MKNINQFKILISCPSDIKEEVEIIESVFASFNDFHDKMGINIRSRHWSKDIYPSAGRRPQELINSQIVKDADAVICIFWTRFGSPTGEYDSGTEEELESLLQSGKQIFLYFSHVPTDWRSLDNSQTEKIKAFEERHKNDILYKSYDEIKDFEKMLTKDLHLYFSEGIEDSSKQDSNLCLNGFSDGVLKNTKVLKQLFDYEKENEDNQEIEREIREIKKLDLRKESQHKMNNPVQLPTITVFSKEPVIFPDEKTQVIKDYAIELGIEINTSFFDLGNLLYQKKFAMPGLYNSGLIGDTKEKGKFEMLNNLYRKIKTFQDIKEYMNQFRDYRIINLCISNNGQKYDEDIDVLINATEGEVKLLRDFKCPGNFIIEEFMENEKLEELFYNNKTSSINEYELNYPANSFSVSSFSMSYSDRIESHRDDYERIVRVIDCFERYKEKGIDKFKINFPYLKSRASCFFPSPLFVKKDVKLKYTINSKHAPLVEGEI